MVRMLVLMLLACVLDAALAADHPIVEALQSPAWVERGGTRTPLAVGMQLRASDRVLSGADGRIMLRMPEGSLVKLGEQAQLALDRISVQREPEGTLVSGALNVLRGAFRFTTQALAGYRGRRAIDVRIATVTAGIRGTDLWGKAADDRDIVCLIDGRISVQRDGESAFTMDQPLSFYIAPRGAPALPVQPVPAAQLAQWATETELRPGAGGARRGGRWRVDVARVQTQAEALMLYDQLREAGYPAEILPIAQERGFDYSVRLRHIASAGEAAALAARLKVMMGGLEPSPVGP
jgi:hypothetical protein